MLDHLGGHVIIINTRSRRVDAGEASPLAADVVVIPTSCVHTGAFAAVSAVVLALGVVLRVNQADGPATRPNIGQVSAIL